MMLLASLHWGLLEGTSSAVVWAVVGLAALAALSTGLLAWRDIHRPGLRTLALGARLLAIALAVVALFDPVWVTSRPKTGENVIAVLVDHSESLSLADGPGQPTRREQRDRLLSGESSQWLKELQQLFDVRLFAFSRRVQSLSSPQQVDATGTESRIGSALVDTGALLSHRPLAGMVLLSDGCATDQVDTAPGGTRVPIYAVPLGGTQTQDDLALGTITVSRTPFEEAPLTIQADVQLRMADGSAPLTSATVRLIDANGKVAKAEVIPLASMGGRARLQFRPTEPGLSFYTLEVLPGDVSGEAKATPDASEPSTASSADQFRDATTINNRRLLALERGDVPTRILYVAGRPNWEYKFLRRAIEEEESLQLTGLIRIARREPKFDWRGRDGEKTNSLFRGFDQVDETTEQFDQPVFLRLQAQSADELREGFPTTPDELFAYSAIVVDDLEAEFFTADQLQLIERFVSQRGGGLLMLGGQESFREGGYAKTQLARLLPVHLDRRPEAPPAPPLRFSLSEEGWLEPWVRIRAVQEEEQRRLATLPPLLTANGVSRIKPGASVLAQWTDANGKAQPAIVVQRFGAGRVAAVTLGDLWRWELEQTDEARSTGDVRKAWRQLVRWMTADVPRRVEALVQADATSVLPQQKLEVRVRQPDFAPMDDVLVEVSATPPDGPVWKQFAEASTSEAGLYELPVSQRIAGGYRVDVKVRARDGKDVGETKSGWAYDPLAVECARIDTNRPLLKQIAEASGGELVEPEGLLAWARGLAARPAPINEVVRTQLWHHPLWLLLLAAALGTDLALRRRSGMP